MSVNPDDYTYSVETDYKSARRHTMLEWHTNPPTEEGWYWAHPGIHRMDVEIVRVVKDFSGELAIAGDEWNEDLDVVSHWLGPLPEPEVPE